MRIEMDCASARVVEGTPDERRWLRDYLTFEDPQARFTNGSAIVELVSPIDDTFPSGLVNKVRKAGPTFINPSGKPAPVAVEVTDVRRQPPAVREADLGWLRDYQRAAYEACVARTRGIIQMPTGGGKTEVLAALVTAVPTTWLIIVPQADLLGQTADRIEKRTGERPGIIGDGEWAPSRVTVATFQTLHRRMSKARDRRAFDFVGSRGGVIVDECHSAAAGTLSFVLSRATSAYYRIGFSATPLDRSDRKSILVVAQLGGIIHRTTSAELRAIGMLADAHIRMVRVEQGSNAPTWPGVYGECVVRSKARNAAVVEMARRARKPALVFVSQVKQGQALTVAIKKAGLRTELVWGEDSTDERRKALADLTEGRLDVIVCSSVFQQAVDIPSLESVVNGAGGASVIQALQRIGRGTRVTATKKSFEVWDVLDDGHRWLTKHGKQRRDAYEREGYRVEVVEDFAVEKDDPRRDEHGFVLGSAAQAKHRAEVRRDTLRELAGVEGLRNPQRGRVLRPHSLLGYSCTDCGAPVDALPPECSGVPPEAEAQGRLI